MNGNDLSNFALKELARKIASTIAVVICAAILVGIIVGLYFLEHYYRWGCK